MSRGWDGVVPSPDELRAYEDVSPGLARELVQLAQNVSERQHTETMANQWTVRWAILAAVVIVLAVMGFALVVRDAAFRYLTFLVVGYVVISPIVQAAADWFGRSRRDSDGGS